MVVEFHTTCTTPSAMVCIRRLGIVALCAPCIVLKGASRCYRWFIAGRARNCGEDMVRNWSSIPECDEKQSESDAQGKQYHQ